MNNYGSYIRRCRKDAGIGLRDFAKQLGISTAYWSEVELEHSCPPRDHLLEKAADLLELDRDDSYLKAGRFPSDMLDNMVIAITLYRQWQRQREKE